MLETLDQGVGRIMATLDRLNLDNDTILVFYSDNGGYGGYSSVGMFDQKKDVTDNAPLRNGKNSFYEGGMRVPLIIRWPGIIKAGTECEVPVIHVDLYPTLLDAVNLDPPEDYLLDGVSLLSLLRNPTGNLSRKALYWHFPGYTFVRFEGGHTKCHSLRRLEANQTLRRQ